MELADAAFGYARHARDLLTDVVLAETLWTLRAAYEQDRPSLVRAVRALLGEAAFAFENREVVADALELFEQGPAGFSDCLVVARHRHHGCEFTATFDRRMPGVRVI